MYHNCAQNESPSQQYRRVVRSNSARIVLKCFYLVNVSALEVRTQKNLNSDCIYINSLAPEKCGCDFRLTTFKLIPRKGTLSISAQLISCEFRKTLPMIIRHWFKLWLGAVRRQAIIWANVDPGRCGHIASLGHNDKASLFKCSPADDHWAAKSETALFNGNICWPTHGFCLSNNYADHKIYKIVPELLTSFYICVFYLLDSVYWTDIFNKILDWASK